MEFLTYIDHFQMSTLKIPVLLVSLWGMVETPRL